MTVAHTPGPWWYDFGRDTGFGPGFTVFGPNVEAVADVTADRESGVDGPTVEANVRLVAAAPELLETLKEFVAHLRSITLDPGEDEDDAPALIAAEALIAKAEGREP